MKNTTGHLLKRGSNYYVHWRFKGRAFQKVLRDENGNPITQERDALRAKDNLMAPFAANNEVDVLASIAGKLEGRKAEVTKWADEQNPPLSIASAWVEFISSPNRPDCGDSTLRQYKFQWLAFVSWMQEKHSDKPMMREVSKEISEDYARSMNQGKFSASTYNKHLNLLTLVFRVLKNKAKLAGNPWEDIKRKLIVSNSRRELTLDEMRTVYQKATGELKFLIALGIYSGLRLGDCATLRWDEVDLARGAIRRIPNKTARRKPKPVIVPLHPILRDFLTAMPKKEQKTYILPEVAALYLRRIDLVTDMIQKHFKDCGIALHKAGTGTNGIRAVIEVGFHSLRHSFVSLCGASDTPLVVVQSIVGHSNPAMTLHYTHVGEQAASRAVASLPSISDDVKLQKSASSPNRILTKIAMAVRKISGKNWLKQKQLLLKILDAAS